jgi:hypothetical protein
VTAPAFAAAQLAAFFATGRPLGDALPQSEAGLAAVGAQEPSEQAIVGPARAGRTPIARIRLAKVVPAVRLALSLGCAAEARPAIPTVRGIDALVAQADRLDSRRMFALDVAVACREVCLAGPDSLVLLGRRAECRCYRPNVGTYRVARGVGR